MRAKVCRFCRRGLPIDQYSPKKSGLFGVYSICRHCANYQVKLDREWKKKNRVMVSELDRLRVELKIIVGKRERKPARDCSVCDDRERCEARVRLGMWAMCEQPDEGDVRRLAWSHGWTRRGTDRQGRTRTGTDGVDFVDGKIRLDEYVLEVMK